MNNIVTPKTFNEFLNENDQLHLNLIIDIKNPPSKKSLIEGILNYIDNFNITLNEDIGKTGDNSKGYGIKGDLKADGELDSKTVVNPDTKMLEDDIKILNSINGKIEQAINLFNNLRDFIEQYQKINHKPIETIIAQLNSFKNSIETEVNKI